MGKQKTKTTSTSTPWTGQESYLKDAFSSAQTNYQNSTPNADMTAAWDAMRSSLTDPNSGYSKARDYYRGVLDSGGYDENVFGNISSRVLPTVNSQFMGSGRTGGGLQGIDLTKELTQAYSPFAVNQMNMAAMALPNLEGQAANSLYSIGRQQYDLPNEALRNYYGIIGANNWGGTTTGKTVQGGNTLGQIAGAGVGLLGSALSGGFFNPLGGYSISPSQ